MEFSLDKQTKFIVAAKLFFLYQGTAEFFGVEPEALAESFLKAESPVAASQPRRRPVVRFSPRPDHAAGKHKKYKLVCLFVSFCSYNKNKQTNNKIFVLVLVVVVNVEDDEEDVCEVENEPELERVSPAGKSWLSAAEETQIVSGKRRPTPKMGILSGSRRSLSGK